jgi:isocitrate lyase
VSLPLRISRIDWPGRVVAIDDFIIGLAIVLYDYLALADWNSATVPAVALNRAVQMVKAGINYKFESGVSNAAGPTSSSGSAEPGEDLAKQSQNPIADLVTFLSRATPISIRHHSVARRKCSKRIG